MVIIRLASSWNYSKVTKDSRCVKLPTARLRVQSICKVVIHTSCAEEHHGNTELMNKGIFLKETQD